MNEIVRMVGVVLRSSGSGPKEPAKAQAEHVGVKTEVRRLDVVIGHVKVAVFQDKGPLRPEKVLDPEPGLRIELGGAAKLGSSKVEGRIEDPGAHIEERYGPPPGLSIQAEQQEDRKSTRLNSSHVEISYAVFCLKKKKKQYPYYFTKKKKKKKKNKKNK